GDDGSIHLVLAETEEEGGQLFSPETGRVFPHCFSPDGALRLVAGEETGDLYIFDLRRLRSQLAELGLDWAPPPYSPAKSAETNPVFAPGLKVDLIGAEWASGTAKIAEYESGRSVAELFFNPFDPEAH